MIKILATFVLFISTLSAQTTNPYDQYFSATKTTSLTAAAETLTVQHTVDKQRNVTFISGYMYCSVACTVTLSRSGTAATTTANSVVALNPNNVFVQTNQALAFNTSNVGAGTTIIVYQLPAGSFMTIDLSKFELSGGVADNLTMGTNSITGTAVLQLTWQEK